MENFQSVRTTDLIDTRALRNEIILRLRTQTLIDVRLQVTDIRHILYFATK